MQAKRETSPLESLEEMGKNFKEPPPTTSPLEHTETYDIGPQSPELRSHRYAGQKELLARLVLEDCTIKMAQVPYSRFHCESETMAVI